MDGALQGLLAIADPTIALLVIGGTLIGIIVGALPGISGSTTTALLLPFAIQLSPIGAVSFLGAIYCAANYGGSITAILVNSPGDPSASATAFDGYPMAQNGEAGRALGMSAVASAIGGIFSIIVMIIAAPLLAGVAYKFGPPEMFALAVFGLAMVAAIGGESQLKNLIGAGFGVMLATIGIDLTTGVERFTFGVAELTEGLDLVPVLIGLFAVAELLEQAARRHHESTAIGIGATQLPRLADFKESGKSILVSSGLGTFIGILPALGATTAALISYTVTRRMSRTPEKFGKGAIEGVAGPEAANNAAVGGAMVPTLALGIPGSTTTAIILAGMIIQGVRPGPHLFNEQPALLYAVFSSMFAANLIYLILGLALARLFARISMIPATFLWPGVFVLSVIGAYAPQQSMFDVGTMLVFGIIGFAMRRVGFSPAPVIIGLVLGRMMEETLKQSLLIFDQNWLRFFERPIAISLLAVTFVGLVGPRFVRVLRAAFTR
jgi:putative tricarboxylic transport membrane protein